MVLGYGKNHEENNWSLEKILLIKPHHFMAKAQGGEMTCPRPQG